MSSRSKDERCNQAELVSAQALGALSTTEADIVETHLSRCPSCQRTTEVSHRTMRSFAAWPSEGLQPPNDLWNRLRARIGEPAHSSGFTARHWLEPEWEQAAPGISCKLLSIDSQRDRVAMLVRLAPAASYPPHTRSGTDELHLLDGELWIDEKKLYPGDYNRAERGTSDTRVWSETGCTCLLITAPSDVLR